MWSLVAVVCLAVASLAAAAVLLSMIFDPEPLQHSVAEPDAGIVQAVKRKLVPDLGGDESSAEDILSLIFSGNAVSVELGRDEVNALFDAAYAARKAGEPLDDAEKPFEELYVHFDGGKFEIHVSRKMCFKTPFGQYLNLRAMVRPHLAGRHFKLEISEIHVGSLRIPSSAVKGVQKKLQDEITICEKDSKIQEVYDFLDELRVDQDKVVIRYYPLNLALFLMKRVDFGGMLQQLLK